MNLPLKIARRYLFAKKSTNAINIITGISVFGLTIGAGALIIVLSVFNGFEDLILGLVSNFNPEVKVTAKVGKVFEGDSTKIAQIENLIGVDKVAQTLEEVAFFEYKGAQDIGILKGVSANNEVVVFEKDANLYQVNTSGGRSRREVVRLCDCRIDFDISCL